MNKEERIELYRKAIGSYGEAAQQIVAMEECSELIQAISKKLRGRETNVEEEIADVEIMVEQMRLMSDSSLVDKIKEEKVAEIRTEVKFLVCGNFEERN